MSAVFLDDGRASNRVASLWPGSNGWGWWVFFHCMDQSRDGRYIVDDFGQLVRVSAP